MFTISKHCGSRLFARKCWRSDKSPEKKKKSVYTDKTFHLADMKKTSNNYNSKRRSPLDWRERWCEAFRRPAAPPCNRPSSDSPAQGCRWPLHSLLRLRSLLSKTASPFLKNNNNNNNYAFGNATHFDELRTYSNSPLTRRQFPLLTRALAL